LDTRAIADFRIKRRFPMKGMTKRLTSLLGLFTTSAFVHGATYEAPTEFFSPTQIKFLAILLALIAFGALSTLFRKMRLWNAPRHTVVIRLSNDETITINDILITLNAQAVQNVIRNADNTSAPLPVESEAKLAEKEHAYLNAATDKNCAKYAVNTFRAYASGRMQKFIPNSSEDPKPTVDDFDEFVSEFCGLREQEGIPHLAAQLRLVYNSCPAADDEALVGWGDRHVLTTCRLTILSTGKTPSIERNIPLRDIQGYEVKCAMAKRDAYVEFDRYYARQPGGAEYLYTLAQLRDGYANGQITAAWSVRPDGESWSKPIGDFLAAATQEKEKR
jgi:hypothetical protein